MDALRHLTDEVRSYSDVLTSPNIAQFLATKNWTCQQDLGFEQVWIYPENLHGRARFVHLPRNSHLDDFDRRLAEAVESISAIYKWRVAEVAEQVASIHADLFFVRVDQSSKDGTIPLRQATALLESIDQMIRSAALTAHSPGSSGKGRLPALVSEFLEEDVRMGHTKKGSFIITVAARLDKSPSASDTHVKSAREDEPAHPGSSSNSEAAVADGIPSYTRQVMTTLARSLEITRKTVTDAVDAPAFDDAVASGMRLPLVQALQSIGQAEGLQSIDMSFEWSSMEPLRADVENSIKIDHNALGALVPIELKLRRRVEPRNETIVGQVIELKRGDGDGHSGGEPEGEIVIRADVDDRLVKVTVPLSGDDYDWAIRAHRAKLPFSVSGELGKMGNSWRLLSNIAADTDFLRHRLGRPPTPPPAAPNSEEE